MLPMAAELMPLGPFPLFQPEDHFAVRVPLGHQPEGLASLCKGEDPGVGLGNDAAAFHKLRDLLELRPVRVYKQKAVFLSLLSCGRSHLAPAAVNSRRLGPETWFQRENARLEPVRRFSSRICLSK